MKTRKDITEQDLAKSGLFTDPDEIKFARVFLNLPTAGKKDSATRKWYNCLGDTKRTKLSESVNEKISQILRAE